MLDHHRAGPQRLRRLLEEAGQHAVLIALDVDLQRIDADDVGFLEYPLQPQRRHPDRLAGGVACHDMAGAEIVAVGLDQEFAVLGARRGLHQPHLPEAGGGMVEGEPRMGDRMRLDRNHLAIGADIARQRQRIGADIGADIDEHAAVAHMRAQKLQLLDVVIGIEQRAALGGAALVIEAECGALVIHVERAGAQAG